MINTLLDYALVIRYFTNQQSLLFLSPNCFRIQKHIEYPYLLQYTSTIRSHCKIIKQPNFIIVLSEWRVQGEGDRGGQGPFCKQAELILLSVIYASFYR